MSAEKLAMIIPATITIGPDIKNEMHFQRYVSLLVRSGTRREQETLIRSHVSPMVEGELRGVAAMLPIEDLFSNRAQFLETVKTHLTEALEKFGLTLYNASIKEMTDHGYLNLLSQGHTQASAEKARVGVIESQTNAQIGELARECQGIKETTRMKAETVLYENLRKADVLDSDSKLQIKEAAYLSSVKIAQIEGEKSSVFKELDMQLQIEQKKNAWKLEKLRADTLSPVTMESENIKQRADSDYYKRTTEADAALYEEKKQADGYIYKKLTEAEAIKKTYIAQARGIEELIKSFESPENVIQYLMMDRGVYADISKINQKAIEGLHPNITHDVMHRAGDLTKIMNKQE